jgi:hypothetical protein
LAALGCHRTQDGALEAAGTGKDIIRALHDAQRIARLRANRNFIAERLPELIVHFATGSDIDPARISPVLKKVSSDSWESDLFRLASLTWAIPVSNGFGRRLRYLVWDEHNDKLIGLIAIGDPVFNLSVRDRLITWNHRSRGKRLVNMMDAYVLGAVPPYNMLLGGKLVACLVRSRELYQDFTRAYGDTTGIISRRKKKARLLAVTTSSSLGRSSVYNRLKLGGVQYFTPIGYTAGWGHFHIPDHLFADLRDFLRRACPARLAHLNCRFPVPEIGGGGSERSGYRVQRRDARRQGIRRDARRERTRIDLVHGRKQGGERRFRTIEFFPQLRIFASDLGNELLLIHTGELCVAHDGLACDHAGCSTWKQRAQPRLPTSRTLLRVLHIAALRVGGGTQGRSGVGAR